MVVARTLFIVLLFAASLSSRQGQDIDITKATRWQDSQDLKFIGGSVKFRAEQDLGDGAKECPELIIDMRFRNQSEKGMRQIDFAIVIYGNKAQAQDNNKMTISKRFNYDHLLPPGATGSLLNELGDCKLVFPVRQTVRIVRIVYEDGSIQESRS